VLCYRLTGKLRAETPLHVGSGQRVGVIKRSLGFIPGSVLRGAVGTDILKILCKKNTPLSKHEECEYFGDCNYAALFEGESGKSSGVFFRYAYPEHLECGGTFLPATKTTYVCKNPQCGKVFKEFISPLRCNCENCKEEIKPFSGFECNRCRKFKEYPIEFSRATSTAIQRSTSTAAMVKGPTEPAGTLHTVETINKGSRFAFEIIVSKKFESHLETLKSALERGLEDEGIGGGKSRGLGKARVLDLKVLEVTDDWLERRAEQINGNSFVVRLVSPMLLEGCGLDTGSLLEGCRRSFTSLFHEGKPNLPEVKLTHVRMDSEIFTGWSLRENRRRPMNPAVSAGSMFQFEGANADRTLALSLAALELHAIGHYKPHGCGQVTIETYA
jgi:CRISPR/Cas system CSM-associated protein Csm3 (group 7 of RAMP superfamily)